MENSVAIERFIEFGQSLFGSDHGWQKKYADRLGISRSQLTNVMSGREVIGPKMRERLRDAGCDMKWFESEKEIERPKNITYWESRTGHFTEDEKKKLDKFINELLTEDDQNKRENAMDVARVVLKQGKKKKD